MALKLWASSTAHALKISCTAAKTPPFLPFSITRCFSSDGLKYSSSHEWVKHEGLVATVSFTDHAQINSSPYDDGWTIKVRPGSPSELDLLMGPKEYTKLCEEEDAHH